MIDTHCHLAQPDYRRDRDEVINRCKEQLDALITSCAHPKDFDLTMRLVEENNGFIFATASIHPIHIREIDENEKKEYLRLIKENRDNILGIGECGLDFFKVKEIELQDKQKELFVELINFAEDLGLPIVVHSREASEEAVDILERENAERVQLHMFGDRELLERVSDNGWLVSVNTIVLRSKDYKKFVRDYPLEQLMLETDAPWLGIGKDGKIKPKDEVRNEPTAVKAVAEKIAEIKKMDVGDVDRVTTENAKKFFKI